MPRRRLLLLFTLLLVALAAALALLRPEAVKHELRDLREAVRRPAGPAATDLSTERTAPVTSDGRTLTTNDPAPFDRPLAARSGASITLGGRTLRPNLHFDMETSADSTMLVSTVARSGRRSMLLKASEEYGPAIRRRAGDVGAPVTSIAAGLWCRTDDPGLVIVTTVHRGEEQLAWYGKELRAHEHTPGVWQRVQGELLLRDLEMADDDVITIYLWNKHRHDTWIDDMDMVFRSGDVLGRDSIRAHDLEDSARTTRPLPFAGVECLGPVDPAQAGLRGGAAPPSATDIVDLPTGTLRWRYRPGDGVARLVDGTEQARYLVRPWCAATGDLLGYERVHVGTEAGALRIIGYDVDILEDGSERIASTPAPRGALLRITTP